MLQCPTDKAFDVWHQRLAGFRKLVFDPGRDFGVDRSRNEPVGFQRPERDGQHTLGNVGNRFLDVAETHRAVCVQSDHDKHRPFVAEPAQDVPDGAISCRMKIFHFFCFY